ncbi:hypothetical protein M747DRAFT_296034 [Aspergillus niger ATCC 13496]|uniref:Secreted protein n=1 Tax=Aspergillus niger ATCC 13496 TaxID=1353008 RepID=A0A370C3K7_ASPNG|nr:hypothetical protein M747DRAFT_296034 [Aspergillus niger ATCC 13496]
MRPTFSPCSCGVLVSCLGLGLHPAPVLLHSSLVGHEGQHCLLLFGIIEDMGQSICGFPLVGPGR